MWKKTVNNIPRSETRLPKSSYPSRFYQINSLRPLETKVLIDGKEVLVQVDTGASVSLMPFSLFRNLFNYRNTPSSVTGKTPNELLLVFAPRTELSMMHPNSQSSCKNANYSVFREGDRVSITVGRNPVMEGIVVRQCGVGSPNYLVCIAGVFRKVHANQMKHAP